MREQLVMVIVGFMLISYTCNRHSSKEATWPEQISMVKTPCKGMCPVYELIIDENGKATFDGKKHVEHIGKFRRDLTEEEMSNLAILVDMEGIAELDSVYLLNAKDLPTTYLTFQKDGKTQKYHFDKSAPEKLQKLEASLHQITEAGDWEAAE